MSGHLGVNKTHHNILNHLFWPRLKSDVSQHCKSCHTCQMEGKSNQNILKAYLQPIPAFDEPFSRIIIDCVCPILETKSGCQYLLTIMCASTCCLKPFHSEFSRLRQKLKHLWNILPLWAFQVLYNLTKVQILCRDFYTSHAWTWH